MLTFASHKKKVKKISIFMSKKFAEHNGLNLTQTNNDVLQMWKEKNVFWRSVTEREGCPQLMDILASITCWRAASRIPSTATRR